MNRRLGRDIHVASTAMAPALATLKRRERRAPTQGLNARIVRGILSPSAALPPTADAEGETLLPRLGEVMRGLAQMFDHRKFQRFKRSSGISARKREGDW